MKGGDSAENGYDNLVNMLNGNFPTFDLKFLPIPPAAAVNKAVNVAENLGDLMVEQRKLELEEKKLALEEKKLGLKRTNPLHENNENAESDTESNNENAESESNNENADSESKHENAESESKNENASDTESNANESESTENEKNASEESHANESSEPANDPSKVQTGGIFFTKKECSFFLSHSK